MSFIKEERTEAEIEQHNYNMGAQNTCFIHWLSFSIKEMPINVIIDEIMSLESVDFIEHYRFKQGYTKSWKHQSMEIYIYENIYDSDMGIFLEIKGSACEVIQHDFYRLCSEVNNYLGEYVRVDIAVDDYERALDINKINEAAKNSNWSGKFRVTKRTECNTKKGESLGKTIEFGSRRSNTSLRIYDKAKQQKVEGHWIRCELELSKGNAQNAIEKFLTGTPLGEVYFGILKNYINFKVPSNDSNKSRWAVEPWWDDFLGDAEKIKIAPPMKTPTMDSRIEWLFDTCSSAFYEFYEEYGYAHIVQLLIFGREKCFLKRQKNVSTRIEDKQRSHQHKKPIEPSSSEQNKFRRDSA